MGIGQYCSDCRVAEIHQPATLFPRAGVFSQQAHLGGRQSRQRRFIFEMLAPGIGCVEYVLLELGAQFAQTQYVIAIFRACGIVKIDSCEVKVAQFKIMMRCCCRKDARTTAELLNLVSLVDAPVLRPPGLMAGEQVQSSL
jgi:hypothetical protein